MTRVECMSAPYMDLVVVALPTQTNRAVAPAGHIHSIFHVIHKDVNTTSLMIYDLHH